MALDCEAVDSLIGFERFPTWMWRNADVLDFIGWLRTHNDNEKTDGRSVGFFGLDLYSLHTGLYGHTEFCILKWGARVRKQMENDVN